MSSSGTYTALTSFNNVNVIEEAFRRLKIDPASLTSDHLVSAKDSIDLLMVDWFNDGVQQFLVDKQTYALVGDGTDIMFTPPTGTIDIISMVYRNHVNQDIQIKPISRQDYLYINNKDTSGQPVCYFVDKTTNVPTVYLWPVQNISGTSIVYNRLRRVQDSGAYTNTPDVTVRYLQALVAGVAAKLACKHADDATEQKLISQYMQSYELATRGDRERVPYVMKPRLGRRFYYGV